ncbi:MAG: putative quinol monooxygenase [Pseudomonadota bacterium]
MIVVNGRLTIDPASLPAIKDALATMETASRAEAGCHDYTFSVEVNDAAQMRITESWESVEALQAHFATPHMAEFRKTLAAHPPNSSDVKFYEVNEINPMG